MLYVRRILDRNHFGVVDTDDYVETVVSFGQLQDAVIRCGLDIKGVKVVMGSCISREIDVYQDPKYCKVAQTKAKVLYGVDIKLSGDEIVSIEVPDCLRQSPCKLKLSDFGTSCIDFILNETKLASDDELVLVLDDDIKITSKSFRGISARWGRIMLDLTSVTRESTVERAYASDRLRGFDLYIYDNPERLDFYRGVGVVCNGTGTLADTSLINKLVTDPDSVGKLLAEKFGKSFIAFADSVFIAKNEADTWVELFLRSKVTDEFKAKYKSGTLDYECVCRQIPDVFWVLQVATGANDSVIRKFRNYARYFNPPDDILSAMKKLCIRTYEWAMCYARENGLDVVC